MSGLEYVTREPPNAGSPIGRMDGSPLPQSLVYVRSNFPLPAAPPEGFEITMPGMAERWVSPEELEGYRHVTRRFVMECAGNGRTLMSPTPRGTPWGLGGASVVEASGPLLRDVLEEVPAEVEEVVFTGADRGTVSPEGEVPYQFSLGRELALGDRPFLATTLGGEPLSLVHGAPVRLMVPGDYAMKSVKWLTRIEGWERPFRGHFVSKYRYFSDDIEEEGAAVGPVYVRSLIASPAPGERAGTGPVTVRGSAWSGMGEITRVELSGDGGQTWRPARLTPDGGDVVAFEGEVPPGAHVLVARATDSTGRTQPLEPRWNGNGYANNVCQRVGLA